MLCVNKNIKNRFFEDLGKFKYVHNNVKRNSTFFASLFSSQDQTTPNKRVEKKSKFYSGREASLLGLQLRP